ncbi:MAG: methionyl-tRNA formyltransferase [Akkermansiaceae bacterium]
MRLVFMATGEIAEPSFAAAISSEHEVAGLVTQPDRPAGRKQVLTAPKVKEMAVAEEIPVIQPEKVGEEGALQQIRDWDPEVIVVMAYGQILPQALIDIPRKAIINLHASLLPKYRGASCVQGPIREGDESTGWSVIHVVQKLDAGNIILQDKLRIRGQETGGELHDRLAGSAPAALREALALLEKVECAGEAQDESRVSYVSKLLREDGRIDWRQSAAQIERLIRAYHPWPGTFTEFAGRRLKIFPQTKLGRGSGQPGALLKNAENRLEIACGNGSLFLETVQPDGKGQMDAESFLRGYGDQLEGGFSRGK